MSQSPRQEDIVDYLKGIEARISRLERATASNVSGVQFSPIAASNVAVQTVFVDLADGKLKYKDASGVNHALY